jgi:uncharacterized protein YbjT (DUF2867 family)
VYAPGDRWLTLIERLALLPVVPMSGRGRAVCQPIWAEDVAGCVVAALCNTGNGSSNERHDLAGPETLTYNDVIRAVLHAAGRERSLAPVPTPLVSRTLRLLERVMGTSTPIAWDEAELLEANMVAASGCADAEALGIVPQAMSAVLG